MVIGILKFTENVYATKGLKRGRWKNVFQILAKMELSTLILINATVTKGTFNTIQHVFSIRVNPTEYLKMESVSAMKDSFPNLTMVYGLASILVMKITTLVVIEVFVN
jgi:hypothetical protein